MKSHLCINSADLYNSIPQIQIDPYALPSIPFHSTITIKVYFEMKLQTWTSEITNYGPSETDYILWSIKYSENCVFYIILKMHF